MKKLIVLAIIMAVILLVAALAQAQSPANDLKPTFISPTPGLYVNGWPAFTVSYPKEWVERPPVPDILFYRRATPTGFIPRFLSGPHSTLLSLNIAPTPWRIGPRSTCLLGAALHRRQDPLRQTLPVEGRYPGPGGGGRICREKRSHGEPLLC